MPSLGTRSELAQRLKHDLLKHLDLPTKGVPLNMTQWRLLLRKIYDNNAGIVILSAIWSYKIRTCDEFCDDYSELSKTLDRLSADLKSAHDLAIQASIQSKAVPDAICDALSALGKCLENFQSSAEVENDDAIAALDWILSDENSPTQSENKMTFDGGRCGDLPAEGVAAHAFCRAVPENDSAKGIAAKGETSPSKKRKIQREYKNAEQSSSSTLSKKRVLIVDDRLIGAERIMSWKRLQNQFEWVTLCERDGDCENCPCASNCGQRRARNWKELLHALQNARTGHPIDVLLMDLNFDDLSPDELLWIPEIPELNTEHSVKALQGLIMARALRQMVAFAQIPIVLMTSRSALPDGASLLLNGLNGLQFVDDDISLDALAARLEAVSYPKPRPLSEGHFFWGHSPIMQEIREQVALLSQGPRTVFLSGPSGSGKSFLVENVILPMSGRKNLITLDLSAVPESLVESELFGHVKGAFSGATQDRIGSAEEADHGILFLDEIGNLSMENQRKLLLFLQDKEVRRIGARQQTRRKVDVKVVVATHIDLQAEVDAGRFRFDLYMRLRPATQIRLPGLAEHSDDMQELIENLVNRLMSADEMRPYVRQLAENCHVRESFHVVFGHSAVPADEIVVRFAQQTLDAFMAYPWPGNTREMENVLDTLILKAFSDVRLMSLPTNILEIDHYYTLSMIGKSSVAKQALPAANLKSAALPVPRPEKVEDLKELRQGLEKQFYIECYRRNNKDIQKMCDEIFENPNESHRHKLIVRMNQLGLKINDLQNVPD